MDVYRVLVIDFGWSHEAWVAWTVATVAEQVFGRDGRAQVRKQP